MTARQVRSRMLVTLLSMVAVLSVVLDAVPAAGVLNGDEGQNRHLATAGPAGGHPADRPSRSAALDPRPVHTVVGLGDSVPAGSACDCESYVSLVGRGLADRQGRRVVSSNLAAPGLTTQGLLDQLADDAARAAVVDADLAIITIGANDFDSTTVEDDDCGPGADMACYRGSLAQLRANMDAILTEVRSLQAREGSTIVVTGYWNVFMDGETGRAQGPVYVANSDKLTLAVNETLAASASAAGVRYVDIYTSFKGTGGTRDDTALLAEDGDHPDAAGHRVIAATVLATLSAA